MAEARAEEFKADPDSLNMLLEMGYPRDDAVIALKISDNNLEQACTFLLSNPNPAQSLGYQVHFGSRQPPRRPERPDEPDTGVQSSEMV